MTPGKNPTHDPQLLKGILSMLLLNVLSEEENYGYAIVVQLQEQGLDLAESTVYPALSRLEKRGLLSSGLVRSESGPARKYYATTKAGADELSRMRLSWAGLVQQVNRLMAEPETAVSEPLDSEPPATETKEKTQLQQRTAT